MERGRDFPSSLSSCKFPPPVTNLPVSRNGAEGRSWRRVGRKNSCGGAVFEKVKPAVVLLFVLGNVEHIVRQRRRRRLLLRSRLDASRAQKKVQSLHYYIDDKAVIQSPGPTFVASLSPPKSPPSIHHALSCPLFFSLPSPLARPDQL